LNKEGLQRPESYFFCAEFQYLRRATQSYKFSN